MSARKIFTQTALLAAVILCMAGWQALAFTEPTGTPPLADVSAPINVGATSQDKSGGGNAWITADGLGSRYGALLATVSGSVSIGTTSNAGTLNIASPTGGTATICLNGSCSASVGNSGPVGTNGTQFELLTSSGTWKIPSAGTTYNAIIICIGGGGGGGAEISITGGIGGTTSFGSLCSAGGGAGGTGSYDGINGGGGGQGGFGGGGGGAMNVNYGGGAGGQGLDFTGGGGGGGANTSVGIGGMSGGGPYQAQSGFSVSTSQGDHAGPGGFPNGGSYRQSGTGGDPVLMFPWLSGTNCGRGGNGGTEGGDGGGGSGRVKTVVTASLNSNQTITIGSGGAGVTSATNGSVAQNGSSGCVGIWYWPVR